ncbi:MAG: hypothetical protein ACXVKH_17225 [Candidatus Angelobacter sp.]
MIRLRFVVPALLIAAALAALLTYFVPPRPPVAPPPQLPEKMPELRMGIPASVDLPKAQEEADDFLQVAQAILNREPNARASADKPTITGHIPLPKRRPIPR